MRKGRKCTILSGKGYRNSARRKIVIMKNALIQNTDTEQNESPCEDTPCAGLSPEFAKRINTENRRASLLNELYYHMVDDPSFIKRIYDVIDRAVEARIKVADMRVLRAESAAVGAIALASSKRKDKGYREWAEKSINEFVGKGFYFDWLKID